MLHFLNGTLAQIPLSPLSPGFSPLRAGNKASHTAQPGEVYFMHCCCPSSVHSCACTPALPQLTETHGAAASINGTLCSLHSQMPSPSSPHAERALCVHDQPLDRSEPGNKTPSLSPGSDWCPPAGVRVGDSSAT